MLRVLSTKGKRNLATYDSAITAISSKSTDVKNQFTDALVSEIDTAKKKLAM